MRGTIATLVVRVAAAVCAAALTIAPAGAQNTPAAGQGTPPAGIHLGVATCAGSNCHGANERPPGSAVPGNEYLIWSKRDKHRQAYAVLLEPRSIRMAHALGLPDAAHQKLCLDCHADDVPPALRGRQFQLSDGVGCEACHGGASGWLGIHISGATHQQNIAAGLYPTNEPIARAEKCLSCHYGDSTKFVTHRLYGAGHPRLAFELDTYTAMQPAHFVVDASYIARKGRVTDLQVWAAGQAVSLIRRMDALLDPKHAPHGLFPEFALYDCQSCHHPSAARAGAKPGAGHAPGTVRLYDANAVMLHAVAERVAPEAATALATHMLALDQAADGDWATVQREAAALRAAARTLEPVLASHDYTRADMAALLKAEIALGTSPDNWQVSHAEQIAMGLEALIANLKSSGYAADGQADAMSAALRGVYKSFADEQTFSPAGFARALKTLKPLDGDGR